jgi:hypothetical protein
MEPLSLRGYAKHRGVTLKAVQKALASGRITKRDDGLIDPDVSDVNWARNTGPRPQTSQKSAPASPHHNVQHHAELPTREPSDPIKLETGLEYSRARAVRESYLARLTKIDFEERTGKLVSRDEVQVAAFNKFRQFRDRMLNIPDRLAAEAAAESDSSRVHELITSEIRKALLEFSDANG